MPLRSLLGLVLVAGGCGGDDGPTTHPVSGKILVDGKPASKAQVTFHPTSGASTRWIPLAETDADGAFRPSTRLTGDGAPAGNYQLTIVWPEIKVDHGEEIASGDRLGRRYADPKGSGLQVTIKEGENVLPPFELKSTGPLPAHTTDSADRRR
jgi:hypothetical protein